mgnify:CR=1 FL=1|tara:strand:- start:880 stop:1470 length:591 start_codon:yes stop_codon:yes gene_type:complete
MIKPPPGWIFEVVNHRDLDIGVDLKIKIEHNNTGDGLFKKFYFLQNDNLKLNLRSNFYGNLQLVDFYKTPEHVKIYKPDTVGRKYLCAMLKFIIKFTRQMPFRTDKKSIIKLFTPYKEAALKVYTPMGFSIVPPLGEDEAHMESSVGRVIEFCTREYSRKVSRRNPKNKVQKKIVKQKSRSKRRYRRKMRSRRSTK